MMRFDPIALSAESTVVAEQVPEAIQKTATASTPITGTLRAAPAVP